MSKIVRLSIVQMKPEATAALTLEKACSFLDQAAAQGAALAVLPELFLGPYFYQSETHAFYDLAEPIPGPTTTRLAQKAKELSLAVVAPIFERRAAGLYHNSLAMIAATGELKGVYRKMHIPDDPLFYEKFYFTPGDLGFKSFELPGINVGTLICWDQWYPEAARLTALSGAELLVYPTAIGWHPSEKAQYGAEQQDAWRTIQRSHAIANGVFVAAVNRVGFEPDHDGGDGLEFWGTSFVAGPMGKVLVQASVDKEEVLSVDLDLNLVEETRRHWPFLRDRRIDAYGGITKRFLDSHDA